MNFNCRNILSNGSILNFNKISLLNVERFYKDQFNNDLWGSNFSPLSNNEKFSSKRSKFKKVNKKTK